MRIGLVSAASFAYPGGVQEHVLALRQQLEQKGQVAKIIAPRHNGAEVANPNFIFLGNCFDVASRSTRGSLSFCFDTSEIDQVLQQERFDLLHYHSPDAPFLMWQILNRTTSEFNIGTFHVSVEGTSFGSYLSMPRQLVQERVIRKLDGVIVVSETARRSIPTVKNMPVAKIPNGVDLKRFHPDRPRIEKFQDGKLNLLFVGRLDGRKGLKYLLEAYKILKPLHPNLRLIVVGSGVRGYWYKAWVLAEELTDVEFVGRVSAQDLPRYYATADIFCSPATHGESFGIVLLEAMATGKPVVAFANSGYKEVLVGLGADFLVEPRDSAGLAQALQKLILNQALRTKMGQWGLQEVRKYSWDKVSQQVLEFYEGIMDKSTKGKINPKS